jgi:hypothetical protein
MPAVNTPLGRMVFPDDMPEDQINAAVNQALNDERERLIKERDRALAKGQTDTMVQTGRGIMTGIQQGASQLLGGVQSAAGEAIQAAGDLVGSETISGIGTAAKNAAVQETVQRDLKAQRNFLGRDLTPEEQVSLAQAAETGVDRGALTARVTAGLAGGAATMGAKTALGTLTAMTTEGALTGALLSTSDAETVQERRADRLGQMKMGAVLGAGFGAFPSVLAGGKNVLAKIMRNFSETPDDIARIADEFGVPVSLGQESGNPVLRAMETQAQGVRAQEMLRKQADEIAPAIARQLGVRVPRLDQVGEGLGRQVEEASTRARSVLASRRAARGNAWRDTMNAADQAAGGAPLYRPFDFGNDLKRVASELKDQFGASSVRPGPVLKDLMNEVDSAVAGGGATAKQIQNWLLRLNAAKGSGKGLIDSSDEGIRRAITDGQFDDMVEGYAGRLKAALDRSVDMAAQKGASNPMQEQAMGLIRKARSEYAAASGEIREIERGFLGALGIGGTPTQILNTLGQADPAIVRSVMKTVDDISGSGIFRRDLRNAVFESAVDAGMQGAVRKGLRTGDLDIGSFAQAFSRNTRRSVLSGLQSPQQEAKALEGMRLMRAIVEEPSQNTVAGVIKTTLPVGVPDLAINVLSRDPGFMARLLAGAVSRGKGADWLFYSDQGRDILKSLRAQKVRTPKWNAIRNTGIVSLATMMQESENE